MNKYIYIFILWLCAAGIHTASAQNNYAAFTNMPDTLDEEDLEAMKDTSLITRRNVATDTNALDYIMEHRYIPSGETFTKSVFDHLYVGAMGGMENVSATDDAHKFGTMAQVGVMVGKELSQFHSFRLTAGTSMGYLSKKALKLSRYMVRLDYLYNLSGYFSGYNPARAMNVSLLAGVGYQYASLQGHDEKQGAPEARIGAQFRFFTGPKGYFAIEPYIGIGGDKIDYQVSKNNWKNYDMFYGLTINYNYYLTNNLSPQSKSRLLVKREEGDKLVADSTLSTWYTPWFFEVATGPVSVNSQSSMDVTDPEKGQGSLVSGWGHEVAISAGKWLSPVLALRLTAASRMSKWKEASYFYKDKFSQFDAEYKGISYNTHYVSGRIDALVNPFGLIKHFSWNRPWGAYLLLGAEMGWLTKYDYATRNDIGEKMSTRSEAYSFGLHLWARLSEDLHFFIEPRYQLNNYRIPYVNVVREERFQDKTMAINMGVTMMMRQQPFNYMETYDNVQNFVNRKYKGFMIGAFAGIPLLQTPDFDLGSPNMAVNFGGHLEYHFNHLHSVMARAEMMSFNRLSLSDYVDYNVPGNTVVVGDPDIGDTQTVVQPNAFGMWENNYKMLLASLDYQVNLTNLLSGRLPKRSFELNLNVGPSILYLLQNDHKLSPSETYRQGHSVALWEAPEKNLYYGANLGFKLSAHIWKGIYFVASPQLYFYKDMKLPGMGTVSASGINMMQTVNFGVQYKIGSLKLRHELRMKAEARRERGIQKRNERWDRKQIKKAEKRAADHEKLQQKRRDARAKAREKAQQRRK